MMVQSLILHLKEYMDFYGDQPVKIYCHDDGVQYPITGFDAFKDEFHIEIEADDIEEDEE